MNPSPNGEDKIRGWNVETLREYLLEMMTERDRRYEQRWRSQEEAVNKAVSNLDARLALLNELRGNVVSREEYEAELSSIHSAATMLDKRITEFLAKASGRSGLLDHVGAVVFGAVVAVCSIVAIIVSVVHK